MKTIVAFDFDGTLTKKDSFIEFIKFCKGTTIFFLNLPYLTFLWLAAKLRIITVDGAKEKVFYRFFKGLSINEFNLKSRSFSSKIDLFLRQEALQTINSFKKPNHEIIIVSASIENWIKPWAVKNEIDDVVATQIEVDKDGFLTGYFLSKNCKGKEKVLRILNKFPNRESYKLISFGNSKGDKELIEFSNKGYMNSIR